MSLQEQGVRHGLPSTHVPPLQLRSIRGGKARNSSDTASAVPAVPRQGARQQPDPHVESNPAQAAKKGGADTKLPTKLLELQRQAVAFRLANDLASEMRARKAILDCCVTLGNVEQTLIEAKVASERSRGTAHEAQMAEALHSTLMRLPQDDGQAAISSCAGINRAAMSAKPSRVSSDGGQGKPVKNRATTWQSLAEIKDLKRQVADLRASGDLGAELQVRQTLAKLCLAVEEFDQAMAEARWAVKRAWAAADLDKIMKARELLTWVQAEVQGGPNSLLLDCDGASVASQNEGVRQEAPKEGARRQGSGAEALAVGKAEQRHQKDQEKLHSSEQLQPPKRSRRSLPGQMTPPASRLCVGGGHSRHSGEQDKPRPRSSETIRKEPLTPEAPIDPLWRYPLTDFIPRPLDETDFGAAANIKTANQEQTKLRCKSKEAKLLKALEQVVLSEVFQLQSVWLQRQLSTSRGRRRGPLDSREVLEFLQSVAFEALEACSEHLGHGGAARVTASESLRQEWRHLHARGLREDREVELQKQRAATHNRCSIWMRLAWEDLVGASTSEHHGGQLAADALVDARPRELAIALDAVEEDIAWVEWRLATLHRLLFPVAPPALAADEL